jgi:hypothetical protein
VSRVERGFWLLLIATCLAGAVALAVTGYQRPTDALTVDRNGYLHGVRYVDELRADPQTGLGWPRDEPGLRAACRNYLDQTERGFDRDAFLAGCADATELPR